VTLSSQMETKLGHSSENHCSYFFLLIKKVDIITGWDAKDRSA
jgi:hypothetical protein